MLDHIALQVHDIAASAAFYDAVLAPLGGERKKQFGENISFGVTGHPLWLVPASGAEVLHASRVWPEYHESYYGAFVRDPDGNNVEAVCHRPG
ncbi:VOC family protein [Streptomyces sp. NPDC042319]|uniref:VOC family protein n=1 Tax=Streptomyces sp. NPDC042319 TaxID=3154332 RepID=UPI0033E2E0AE